MNQLSSLRLVSLLPSATEIITCLGLADNFNRPGTRLVESLEILHPAHCNYGHRDLGWVKLAAGGDNALNGG